VILYGSRDAGWGVAAAIAAALIALPWIAGYAFRTRRLYVEAVEERLATVERERDERARQAARDERAHIARELHDIVAHHVSVIGVQAGAARVSLDTSPQETRAALLTIESASRQAVGEMRHLLSALREDDTPQDGAESPQPGLADLDALVRSFAAAGLTVVLSKRGDDDLLAPTLDLCCYRIIEEALTNVTRHSASRQAGVDVEVGTSAVHITVNDPGPATPKPGSGRGQVGMRERVGLFGGVLNVGPDGRGGFLVDATIPRNSGAGS
jgi:signal transduction histidine kinase